MKVLGIDPGLAQTGWAILKKNSNQIELIKCGCIETNPKLELSQRLNILYSELKKIIEKYTPELIAIEKQFLYQKSQTVLHTSEARGIILLLAGQKKLKVKEYNPKEVKIALTGY
ncbi:MAG: crossover junction endodeoxyribonuclease RuvC, partial [Endomicrobiia bacterium]